MGDLTEHFSRSEFICRCGCGQDNIDLNLVAMLEQARLEFGSAIRINSGVRCPEHNKDVGGAVNSKHLNGQAADLRCSYGRDRRRLIIALDKAGLPRIGIAKRFIHVDLGDGLAPTLFLY